jgi:hypothetical protein
MEIEALARKKFSDETATDSAPAILRIEDLQVDPPDLLHANVDRQVERRNRGNRRELRMEYAADLRGIQKTSRQDFVRRRIRAREETLHSGAVHFEGNTHVEVRRHVIEIVPDRQENRVVPFPDLRRRKDFLMPLGRNFTDADRKFGGGRFGHALNFTGRWENT